MASRVTGYSLVIRAFVRVDTTDVDDMVNKAEAIRDAVKHNDLAKIDEIADVQQITQKFGNIIDYRRVATDEEIEAMLGGAPASEEPEGEGSEAASEAQAEEAPRSRRARGAQAAE